jgi:hypothetical protein
MHYIPKHTKNNKNGELVKANQNPNYNSLFKGEKKKRKLIGNDE